eukprot:413296-Pyramimonas_sp.AAC.1
MQISSGSWRTPERVLPKSPVSIHSSRESKALLRRPEDVLRILTMSRDTCHRASESVRNQASCFLSGSQGHFRASRGIPK